MGLLTLLIVPSRYIFAVVGLIVLRHPVLRSPGSIPGNLFSRFPNRQNELKMII